MEIYQFHVIHAAFIHREQDRIMQDCVLKVKKSLLPMVITKGFIVELTTYLIGLHLHC